MVSEHSVLSAVRKAGEEVGDRVFRLNWGGCGVYAAALGRALHEVGCKVQILCYEGGWTGCGVPIPEQRKLIRAKFGTTHVTREVWDIFCDHMLVKWRVPDGNWYLSDSEDTVPWVRGTVLHNGRDLYSEDFLGGYFTVPECEAMSYVEDCPYWNSMYGRSQNTTVICTVRQAFREHFGQQKVPADPREFPLEKIIG